MPDGRERGGSGVDGDTVGKLSNTARSTIFTGDVCTQQLPSAYIRAYKGPIGKQAVGGSILLCISNAVGSHREAPCKHCASPWRISPATALPLCACYMLISMRSCLERLFAKHASFVTFVS